MIRPALIAPLLMVAACDWTAHGADAPGDGGSRPAAALTEGRVALALLPHNQGGATAAAGGTLGLRGQCLVLEASGDFKYLAFATADTAWDEKARALRVGGRSYPLGARLDPGGGEFSGSVDALPWVQRPPAECGPRLWIVSSIEPG
jgi:hypothetical protein